MQGLADGYFVIPYTIGDYLAGHLGQALSTDTAAFQATEAEVNERVNRLVSINGKRSADSFHRELGRIVWDYCGIARNAEGLQEGPGADPGAARGVLAATCASWAAPTSSTRSWRRPAGWPTTSSWPS